MRTIWSFFRLDTREEFPALTGIRAIAAFMVFFHHYTPSAATLGMPLYAFLREGHCGVTIFYVLSGFLIAWNYLEKSADRSTRFWGPYMLKRVARIHPLYLLLLFANYARCSTPPRNPRPRAKSF